MPSYDQTFFTNHRAGSLAAARAVVPVLRSLTGFASVVDVGCGTGEWLSVFAESGITEYLGLDGPWVRPDALAIPRERFMPVDLAAPPALARRFDLAVSVEVAEHLPPSAAENFVGFLASLAPVTVFSAAIPGQGGTGHINERWPDEWAALFAARGRRCIDGLRMRLWDDPAVPWWYAQNLLLFASPEAIAASPALARAAAEAGGAPPRRLVHPGCLDAAHRQPLTLSRVIHEGPGALRRAVEGALRRSGGPA